jgi:hypothetical protein
VGLLRGGRGDADAQVAAEQVGHAGERRAGLVGHRVAPRPLAEPAQQGAEVVLPAGRGRLHPGQAAGPAQQAALGRRRVGPEELVRERRAAAEILQHQQPRLRVVRDDHRARPDVGGQRREQLAARDLVAERVGPVGLGVA